jgi:hypothetical protein
MLFGPSPYYAPLWLRLAPALLYLDACRTLAVYLALPMPPENKNGFAILLGESSEPVFLYLGGRQVKLNHPKVEHLSDSLATTSLRSIWSKLQRADM